MYSGFYTVHLQLLCEMLNDEFGFVLFDVYLLDLVNKKEFSGYLYLLHFIVPKKVVIVLLW
jgi:hypothetical protein